MEGFRQFAGRYTGLIERDEGIADFGAAGNDDHNDADDDVAFPQAQLGRCNIIGACDRRGVPCEWSGDGRGVLCVMWGDRVWSPDAAGIWSLWSGTSAATPKACGGAAALELTTDAWRQWVKINATRPKNWRGGEPHPKWGYGCGEEAWQQFMAIAPKTMLPPKSEPAQISVHDYRPALGRPA